MSDKSLPVVLMDFLVAAVSVTGFVFAMKVFHVPNCTAIGREPVFLHVRDVSAALAAGCVLAFLIGMRESSTLSKAIGASCALALVLLWMVYTWKLHAIAALAC